MCQRAWTSKSSCSRASSHLSARGAAPRWFGADRVRAPTWPEAGVTVIQGILGRKLGMTRLFDATGAATATTIVEAGPCFVTQIKTLDRDGYEAVQLGFEQVRDRKLTTPERGHLKASGTPSVKVLRE